MSPSPDQRMVALPENQGSKLLIELNRTVEESEKLKKDIQNLLENAQLDTEEKERLKKHLKTLDQHLKEQRTSPQEKHDSTPLPEDTSGLYRELEQELTERVAALDVHIQDLQEQMDALTDMQSVHASQLQKLEKAFEKKQNTLRELKKAQVLIGDDQESSAEGDVFSRSEPSVESEVIRARAEVSQLNLTQKIAAIEEDLPFFEQRIQDWKQNPRFQNLDKRIAAKQASIDEMRAVQTQKRVRIAQLSNIPHQAESGRDPVVTPLPLPDMSGLQASVRLLLQRGDPSILHNIATLSHEVSASAQRALQIFSGAHIADVQRSIDMLRRENRTLKLQAEAAERTAAEAIEGGKRALGNWRRQFTGWQHAHHLDEITANRRRQEAESERDRERQKRTDAEEERDRANRKVNDLQADLDALRRELGSAKRRIAQLEDELRNAQQQYTTTFQHLQQAQNDTRESKQKPPVIDVSEVLRLQGEVEAQKNEMFRISWLLEQEQDRRQAAETALNNRTVELTALREAIEKLQELLAEARKARQLAEFERDQARRERDRTERKNERLEDKLNQSPNSGPPQHESLAALIMLLADKLNLLPQELERLLSGKLQPSTSDETHRLVDQQLEEELLRLQKECTSLQAEQERLLDELKATRERLEDIETENRKLKAEIEEQAAQITGLSYQLAASEEARVSLLSDLQKEQNRRATAENSLGAVQKEMEELRKKVAALTQENILLVQQAAQAEKKAEAEGKRADEEGQRADTAEQDSKKKEQDLQAGLDDLRTLYLAERGGKNTATEERDEAQKARESAEKERDELRAAQEAWEKEKALLEAEVLRLNADIDKKNLHMQLLEAKLNAQENNLEIVKAYARAQIQRLKKERDKALEALADLQKQTATHESKDFGRTMPMERTVVERVVERKTELISLEQRMGHVRQLVEAFDLNIKQTMRLLMLMILDDAVLQKMIERYNSDKNGSAHSFSELLNNTSPATSFIKGLCACATLQRIEVHTESLPEATLRGLAAAVTQQRKDLAPKTMRERLFPRKEKPLEVYDALKKCLSEEQLQAIVNATKAFVGFQVIKNFVISEYQKDYPETLELDPRTKKYVQPYEEILPWFQATPHSGWGDDLTQRYLNSHPQAVDQVVNMVLSEKSQELLGMKELVG